MRPRELPPLPQRGQRSLPTMPSQDTAGEEPATKQKKKKLRRDTSGANDMEEQEVEMGGITNRRESQTSDKFTAESSTDAPPQKKKKKKKKKAATVDLDDDQTDLVNGADQTSDREEVRKTRKKKKSKLVESQLPDDLELEGDDVITETLPSIPQLSLFSAPSLGQSHQAGRFFVERNKRFDAAERRDWRATGNQMDNMADLQHVQPPSWTTRDVAIRVHEGFRVLGLYCHGFLAGLAVWNMVVVYMLSGRHLATPSNLLQQYHGLAYPFQCLLYLLLAVSTVATFDRLNLAKVSMALREFVTLDPMALASFLYFSALILSLSQQMTSDRINLYPIVNSTIWSPGSEHQVLHPWVTINLVVALLVGLAWILMATRPETDYTEGYLMAMEIEPPRLEDKSQITP